VKRSRKLLVLGSIRGTVDPLERLFRLLPESATDLVAVLGDLVRPGDDPGTHKGILRALAESRWPTYWIPGAGDGPISGYLREAYNLEIASGRLHAVHGSAVLDPGKHYLFAGMGGEIVDDPDEPGDERQLRYPGWEAEYRLKVVHQFEQVRILMFTTPPAHKGLGEPGSEVVAELLKTHRARFALVPGDEPAAEWLGTTLVVTPGRFDEGKVAFIDLHEEAIEADTLAEEVLASA
jgi:uncharacterized protein